MRHVRTFAIFFSAFTALFFNSCSTEPDFITIPCSVYGKESSTHLEVVNPLSLDVVVRAPADSIIAFIPSASCASLYLSPGDHTIYFLTCEQQSAVNCEKFKLIRSLRLEFEQGSITINTKDLF